MRSPTGNPVVLLRWPHALLKGCCRTATTACISKVPCTQPQSRALLVLQDLALTSPVDYYREGEGSLMQCVLTPADAYMPLLNEAIAEKVDRQVLGLRDSRKAADCFRATAGSVGVAPEWQRT